MNDKGKAGCGCLLFILVACMVVVGIFMHPFTLKMIGSQLRYEDKIFPADAIFVPRFPEDKNGELYMEAFREYWAGNGKTIWVEDDKILGMSILDIITKTAKARGIKEEALKRLDVGNEDRAKADKIDAVFSRSGAKKVIIVVPEYASRRFHMIYGSPGSAKVSYLVKPASVSYFKKERWWKEPLSRSVFLKEVSLMINCYFEKFKYGDKEDTKKSREGVSGTPE